MSGDPSYSQRLAPRPRGYPLVGVLPHLLRNPIPYLSSVLRSHGDLVRLDLGFGQIHVISHPDYVQHVLRDHGENYDRAILVRILRRVFGNGMGTSEGQVWLQKRRMLQPIFSRQHLVELVPLMINATQEALARWPPPQHGGRFELASGMDSVAMQIILRTMFDTDLSQAEMDRLGDAVQMIIDHIGLCVWTDFFPPWIPMPGAARFRQAIRTIDDTIYRLIAQRRRGGGAQRKDLLSLLLSARDVETGQALDDTQVRDEAMALFMAGYETTSTAVTWSLYLLSQHPEAEARLRAELDAVLGDRAPGEEDLSRLPYTKMVLQESMRIYPPGWMMARRTKTDDTIGGCRIPADSFVGILIHALHRHPAYWEEPERFLPERFLPERSADRHRYAYLPFGAGPRQCIGGGFAMMEGPLILAMVMQRYRMRLVPGHPIEPKPALTLYPRHGIMMNLSSASGARPMPQVLTSSSANGVVVD